MGSLAGQSALVTGAGRGIGKALAQRLAAEGAHVTVTARSRQQVEEVAAQIEAAGGGDSARDLARCGDVVVALASRKYDGLAGRYLDIDWDLDAKLQEVWRTAVSAPPVIPDAVSTPK